MDGQERAWASIAISVFLIFVVGVSACDHRTNQLKLDLETVYTSAELEMVVAGASPIAARCAVRGGDKLLCDRHPK